MRLEVVNTPCGSIKPAGSRAHVIAGVGLVPLLIALRVSLLRHPAVRIGHADDRVVIRRRGARLEGFQEATTARTGAHATLGIDADELDAGGHLERDGGGFGGGGVCKKLWGSGRPKTPRGDPGRERRALR